MGDAAAFLEGDEGDAGLWDYGVSQNDDGWGGGEGEEEGEGEEDDINDGDYQPNEGGCWPCGAGAGGGVNEDGEENEGGVDWRDWGGDVGEGVEGSAGNGGGVSQWSKGVDRRTHVSQV